MFFRQYGVGMVSQREPAVIFNLFFLTAEKLFLREASLTGRFVAPPQNIQYICQHFRQPRFG